MVLLPMEKISKLLIATITIGVLGNLFYFREFTFFGLSLFFFLLSSFILFTAKKYHKSMWVLCAVIVISVLTSVVRSSPFVLAQTLISIFQAMLVLWYLSISEEASFSSFTEVLMAPIYAGLSYLGSLLATLRKSYIAQSFHDISTKFQDNKSHSRSLSNLLGISISVPVVVLLVLFFASADPIYYSFLKRIIYPEILSEIPIRLVLSLILMFACIPLLSPKARRVFISPGEMLSKVSMSREISIVMTASAVVILSFIVVQWPYVFANVKAETDLSQFGVATYAEYVKKGFLELLRVSAFIYLILWTGVIAIRKSSQNSKFLFIVQTIVSVEFLILVISIARRVYLYQMYHGLTIVRVYGMIFLLVILALTLTLTGRLIFKKVKFGQIEGAILVTIFLIISFWNVEKFIVQTAPPTVNKRVDHVYLSRLSPDGVLGWSKSFAFAQDAIRRHSATSGGLDAHARQEIAYARYVLFNLTKYYEELAFWHADREDFKNYVNQVVSFQIGQLEKELAQYEGYQFKADDWYLKKRPEEIRKTIDALRKIPDKLVEVPKAGAKKEAMDYANVVVASWSSRSMTEFRQVNIPEIQSFYHSDLKNFSGGESWYEKTFVDRYADRRGLDILFHFNLSEQNAYEMLRSEVTLDELHKLQLEYFDLETRISKQADRKYELDISLDSPFVD